MDDDEAPALDVHEPGDGKDAFNCPHCGAFAHQRWGQVQVIVPGRPARVWPDEWAFSLCVKCDTPSVWHRPDLIYPRRRVGPMAHEDMPDNVRAFYDEAREVAAVSRKSAAALLRLALQVLVDQLQPGSATVNDKIGALVKGGLDPNVQQAMDVLRVVGNNAVHPGQIDLDADGELVPALFGVLNMIVEQVVSRPKRLAQLYASLPASTQAAIGRRDATGTATSGASGTSPP